MKLTPEKKIAFLAALSATCNVTKACKATDLSRETAYKWRRENDDFAAEWEVAMDIGAEALEDEAKRRGFDGVDEPVFHQGVAVDTIRKYSDTLAIFLLKGALPEKYADRNKTELTGKGGGPVEFTDTERAARIQSLLNTARTRKLEDDDFSDLV